MDWFEIANDVCQVLLPLVLTALSVVLIVYINKKIEEGKQKSESDLVDKYLTMLQGTVEDAVLTTTQTYVEALKNKNMFDEEAQKHAFELTYDAVMKVLTDDAKKYIESAVGDLDTYITNKIESTVKLSK
jgi:outer membrane protein assembly factor BamD (BamD/ComL family)